MVAALAESDSRLVTISSADVYRNYDGLRHRSTKPVDLTPLKEDAPLREKWYPYRDASDGGPAWLSDYEKLEVERTVREACGDATTILRLGKVHGPDDPQDHVGGYWRRIVSTGEQVALEVGQGQWRWTRVYVEDVAEAIATVVRDVRSRGRTYNVGDLDALTEADWIRTIGTAGGRSVSCRERAPERLPEGERPRLAWEYGLELSTAAIRRELGFREVVGRSEGIRRTVATLSSTATAV